MKSERFTGLGKNTAEEQTEPNIERDKEAILKGKIERANNYYGSIISSGMEMNLESPEIKSKLLDIYSEEELNQALKAGESVSAEWVDKPDIYSDFLEKMFVAEGEINDLFGVGTRAIRTGKPDDYFRGIDLVLEFPPNEKGEVTRLCADVTVAESDEVIHRKTKHLESLLRKREGSMVKYFVSPTENESMVLTNVPQVIINIPRTEITHLMTRSAMDLSYPAVPDFESMSGRFSGEEVKLKKAVYQNNRFNADERRRKILSGRPLIGRVLESVAFQLFCEADYLMRQEKSTFDKTGYSSETLNLLAKTRDAMPVDPMSASIGEVKEFFEAASSLLPVLSDEGKNPKFSSFMGEITSAYKAVMEAADSKKPATDDESVAGVDAEALPEGSMTPKLLFSLRSVLEGSLYNPSNNRPDAKSEHVGLLVEEAD